MLSRIRGITLLVVVLSSGLAYAQESSPSPPERSVPPASLQTQPTKNGAGPCIEPAPLLRLRDYSGPFKKAVGIFAQKLEITAVRQPQFRPGVILCSLNLKDKFVLFLRDTYNPGTLLVAAFNAGLGQALDQDPTFGQGAVGYGKRYGASLADEVSFTFFEDFAYPTIFSEDPRYYRLGPGSGRRRVVHAATHVLWAHRDNGKSMFNFSEWLGTTSAVVLSNMYHPGNRRGAGSAAGTVGFSIGEDVGFDFLREFWPEISRKLRLPFRGEHEPQNPTSFE
jgi:hypothetical protein